MLDAPRAVLAKAAERMEAELASAASVPVAEEEGETSSYEVLSLTTHTSFSMVSSVGGGGGGEASGTGDGTQASGTGGATQPQASGSGGTGEGTASGGGAGKDPSDASVAGAADGGGEEELEAVLVGGVDESVVLSPRAASAPPLTASQPAESVVWASAVGGGDPSLESGDTRGQCVLDADEMRSRITAVNAASGALTRAAAQATAGLAKGPRTRAAVAEVLLRLERPVEQASEAVRAVEERLAAAADGPLEVQQERWADMASDVGSSVSAAVGGHGHRSKEASVPIVLAIQQACPPDPLPAPALPADHPCAGRRLGALYEDPAAKGVPPLGQAPPRRLVSVASDGPPAKAPKGFKPPPAQRQGQWRRRPWANFRPLSPP
ncbi:MAG: hypothetical protein GY772_21830 [bacterium]|nr:hypothetical protein [bacterium]